MSSAALRAPALLLAAAALSCRPAPREPLVTFFSGDHGLSIRYPSSWRTEQAEQANVWYRYFLAPPEGAQGKPAVSVTLLVGQLPGSVEEYAQSYLAGNELVSARDEERGPARGRSYLFRSRDGALRHALLLLKAGDRVFGLYSQGAAPLFEKHYPVLDEMAKSLSLERVEGYAEEKNERFAFALRVPPSWKETRRFSGGASFLLQYRSPALAADADRDPVHASLTLAIEPVADGGLQEYYDATRLKLGDSFQIISHGKWSDGYVDQMRTETPVTVSRVKRFYRVAGGRGYTLSFEAREDVFPRVSRWCDLIASSLRAGEELKAAP